MTLNAIKITDRFGNIAYRCPLCGHIFYNQKQYTKHLYKSHLRKVPKKKRARKKLLRHKEIIAFKRAQEMELSEFEKYIELKTKLNTLQ